MAVKNSLVEKKETFSSYIGKQSIQGLIQTTLQNDNKRQQFTTGIVSAISTNPTLRDCDYGTIVSAGLLGSALNLSPSPQLGYFYLVPFNDTKNQRKVATFQLG